jgi:hypothetical protein
MVRELVYAGGLFALFVYVRWRLKPIDAKVAIMWIVLAREVRAEQEKQSNG